MTPTLEKAIRAGCGLLYKCKYPSCKEDGALRCMPAIIGEAALAAALSDDEATVTYLEDRGINRAQAIYFLAALRSLFA